MTNAPKSDEPNLRSVKSLLDSGWTEKLIKDFLGPPDVERKNHRFSTGGAVRLYAADRVERAKASPEFAKAQADAFQRQAAGLKIFATKERKSFSKVEKMQPEIRVVAPEQLLQGALRAYHEHQEDLAFVNGPFYDWERLTEESDERELARIQADYILQRLSNYDKLRLTELPTTVGWADALDALQTKFFDALDAAYPALHEEWIRYRSELRDELRRLKRSWV